MSNMIKKANNQELINNYLNGLEKKRKETNCIIYTKKNVIDDKNFNFQEKNNLDTENFEMDKQIFNSNLKFSEIKDDIPKINLARIKLNNFEEKVSKSLNTEKEKTEFLKRNNIKDNRLNKIKNFIQGITNFSNKKLNENEDLIKKDVNNSINFKEKTKKTGLELDSDYDLFLGKPLTDREERGRTNTIFDLDLKIELNKKKNFIYDDPVEVSFKYEEGESEEFNERDDIINRRDLKYNTMKNLYFDKDINKKTFEI